MKLLRSLACLTFALVATSGLPAAQKPASGKLEVVTQNLYVGADLFRVASATSASEVPFLVAETLEIILQTDFPTRVERIAELIGRQRPDLIGLQEVSLIRTQSPGDFFLGNPQPAQTVLCDHLELLMQELSELGLDYYVASEIQNVDVELPLFAGVGPTGLLFDDLRLTDRDVLLARRNVMTGNELSNLYADRLSFDIGGFVVEFLRGYTSVEAVVRGRTFRVVNTHLEVGGTGGIEYFQSMQAQELIDTFAFEPYTTVFLGDFNSDPDAPLGPFVSPYDQMVAAGYQDAWSVRKGPSVEEETCCQAETVDNPSSLLSDRYDQVWVRSMAQRPAGHTIGPVQAILLGKDPADMIEGLWPSDHAGVFTRLHLKMSR